MKKEIWYNNRDFPEAYTFSYEEVRCRLINVRHFSVLKKKLSADYVGTKKISYSISL